MPPTDYTSAIGGALKFKGSSKDSSKPKRSKASSKRRADEAALPDRNEDEGAAIARRPSGSRRASDRNETDAAGGFERPELKRRRTSGQSGEVPVDEEESPTQKRIRSPDPQHKEGDWHSTPAKPMATSNATSALDAVDNEQGLSPKRSKSLEAGQSIAEALKATTTAWSSSGKTEAERRQEEMRRRRWEERLRREGVKTHKERVEEFNKKLAAQSEHHDMPKIGPG